jgi:hypothetical protein
MGLAFAIESSAEKFSKAECPEGEHFVRAHAQAAYRRMDGTFVSGSNHPLSCRKNQVSYIVWSPRIKAGMPPNWEFKTEKSKKWADGERERVLDALSSLPKFLLADEVNGIYRLKTSNQLRDNPASNFRDQFALYDPAFDGNQNTARILAHELTLGRKGIVAEDCRVSPEEDFANNIEYFLFDSKTLKEKSPKVFEWLSKKYGDKLKLESVK